MPLANVPGDTLRIVVTEGRVETRGLAAVACNELAVAVSIADEEERARVLLARLAAYVVSAGARLKPGEVVVVDDRRLALARGGEGVLVVELEDED